MLAELCGITIRLGMGKTGIYGEHLMNRLHSYESFQKCVALLFLMINAYFVNRVKEKNVLLAICSITTVILLLRSHGRLVVHLLHFFAVVPQYVCVHSIYNWKGVCVELTGKEYMLN